MKCPGVERTLTLFVGEELEGRRKREIEDHLAGCERCRLLQEDLSGQPRVDRFDPRALSGGGRIGGATPRSLAGDRIARAPRGRGVPA